MVKSNEAVALTTAPNELNQKRVYSHNEHLSRAFSRQQLQELLGRILFTLNWDATSESDRTILLMHVEGLERKLIDLRRGGYLDG